jgi:hypothetical protein
MREAAATVPVGRLGAGKISCLANFGVIIQHLRERRIHPTRSAVAYGGAESVKGGTGIGAGSAESRAAAGVGKVGALWAG